MKTSITHLRIGTLAEPHVHYAGKDERAIAALEHQVIEWCSGAAALPKGSTMTPGAFKHEERAAGMSISPCNSCVSWLSHTALYFAFAVLVMPRMRGGLTLSAAKKRRNGGVQGRPRHSRVHFNSTRSIPGYVHAL